MNKEEFLERARTLHEGKYEYEFHEAAITVKCNTCSHSWRTTMLKHLDRRSRCSQCKKHRKVSRGEASCKRYLEKRGIKYEEQYVLPSLPGMRYDFFFLWRDKGYVLEYDGKQHFQYVKFFHKDTDGFKKCLKRDMLKVYAALSEGLGVIRIDFTNRRKIISRINEALSFPSGNLYLSNPDLYIETWSKAEE